MIRRKLLVHRKARRRGIGPALMHAAEEAAHLMGNTLLVLDTAEGSEAERLYERLGWQLAGRIPGYALLPRRSILDSLKNWRVMFRWPFAFLPMRCRMVEPSSFKATVGEWKTVIEAMKHYKKYLEDLDLKDEDQQLVADDDIHRLMMMIPDFERQFKNNYPGVI